MDDREITLLTARRSASESLWMLVVFIVGFCLLALLVLMGTYPAPGHEDLEAATVNKRLGSALVIRRQVRRFTRRRVGEGSTEVRSDSPWQPPHTLALVTQPPLRYSLGRETKCSSKVCLWNTEYLYRVAEEYDRPCDDFYEYVCEAIKLNSNGHGTTNLSYAELSTRQLMLDFDIFFKRFIDLKKKPTDGVNDNFLVQAVWLYERCVALPNSSHEEATLDAFGTLLDTLRIGDWPYMRFPGDVLTVVSTADRLLMLQTLFRLNVLSGGEKGRNPQILLRTPMTYLGRYVSSQVTRNATQQYEEIIGRCLRAYGNCSFVSHAAHQIFKLEENLQNASYFQRYSATFAVKRFTTVGQLARNKLWDWRRYLRLLFETEDAITNSTLAFVEDPAFFSKFASIIDPHHSTAIANYVGFKAMVTLWPYMPSTLEFLGNLSIDTNTAHVDQRLVACTGIIEKMYRYGVGIAAKLGISREFFNIYQRQRDKEFATLFAETRAIVKQLLQSGGSWFHSKDAQRAQDKLDNMTLAFGTGHDFISYERYRKTQSYFVASSGTALDAAVRVLSYASAVYWSAFVNNSQMPAVYDNAYAMSVFEWGSEYQPTNNHIFIPNAVVGCLSEISKNIPFQLYPAVLQHVVRAMLRAVIRSNSIIGNDMKPHEWWHVESVRSYSDKSECLRQQYDAATGSGHKELLNEPNTTTLARLEDDFLDNAILWPLYKLYDNALQKHNWSDKYDITPRKYRKAKELFFYNYASTYCAGEHNTSSTGEPRPAVTPAKWRVNLPLKNFPPFRQAFSCDKHEPKIRYCEVWKGAR